MRPRVGASNGVVVVGDALVDVVESSDGTEEWFPGGAGLNVAVGLARMGVRTQIAYPAADDARGRWLREILAGEGVTVAALPSGPESGIARSRRKDGEPEYTFNDALLSREYTYPREVLREILASRVLAVSSFPIADAEQVSAVLDVVRAGGMTLAVDPNVRPALLGVADSYRTNFLRLAAASALVKLSSQDIEVLFPGEATHDVVELLLSEGTPVVVVTDGAAGASAHTTGGASVTVAAAALAGPVVDTMGAGDAVFSRLLAEFAADRWPQDAAEWRGPLEDAMALAGATCCVTGGLPPASLHTFQNQGELNGTH